MKNLLLAFALTINAAAFAQTTDLAKSQTEINYSLKGPNGQLLIKLPEQASLNCLVNKSGETKSFSLKNELPKELLPGNYEVSFWGIKFPVIVEKGKDTKINAGILNSTVKGLWEVWTTDGMKIFFAGSPKKVALPVGKYIIKTDGAEFKSTINPDQITIFSYTKY